MTIELFHGSRGGIAGAIAPISRTRCDCGVGFYMGDKLSEVQAMVTTDSMPYLYTLQLDISKIDTENIIKLSGIDWAFFVLYNRGQLSGYQDTVFHARIAHLVDGGKLLIGPMENNALNKVIRDFSENRITEKALLACIREFNVGTQYVAKTLDVCQKISIISEHLLMPEECLRLDALRMRRTEEQLMKASEIYKKYRRDGRYLDEIFESEQERYASDYEERSFNG